MACVGPLTSCVFVGPGGGVAGVDLPWYLSLGVVGTETAPMTAVVVIVAWCVGSYHLHRRMYRCDWAIWPKRGGSVS